MIALCKESKFKKLNKGLVVGVAVSQNEIEDTTFYPDLLPPPSLMIAYNNGDIGKKKFKKKYAKFLKKSELVEYAIYILMLGVKNQKNICFVCNDDEWSIGYLDVLVNHISEQYDVNIYATSEVKEAIANELNGLSKKERKLVKMTEAEAEELSEKAAKFRYKLLKKARKNICMDAIDNIDYLSYLDKKYAIDKVMSAAQINNAFKYDKKGNIVDIDEDKLGKSSLYVEAVFTACEAYKPYKKIAKDVFESHSLKFKPKAMKKLSKVEIINLVAEISAQISTNRVGVTAE